MSRRTRSISTGLLVVVAGWLSFGCANSNSDDSESNSPAAASADVATEATPATTVNHAAIAEAEAEVARVAEAIAKDRDAAIQIIYDNGGCYESNIEHCIANVLLFIAPDSPAIGPALKSANDLDDEAATALAEQEREARQYLEAVAQAEAGQQLTQFYAAVAHAEAVQALEAREQAELANFYRAAALAQQAETDARRIGENLVASQCANGGYYEYWTNPPGARVTSCNAAPRQASSNSNGRTGAVCNDGTSSSATGQGACSWHGGVWYWTY